MERFGLLVFKEFIACISFGEMLVLGWASGEGFVCFIYFFHMFSNFPSAVMSVTAIFQSIARSVYLLMSLLSFSFLIGS